MKKIIIKRGICLVLSLTCIINNVSHVSAKTIDEKIAVEDLDAVYIDGVRFDIDIDLETGNILVSGEEAKSSMDMILYTDALADVNIENNGIEEEYNIEINELNNSEVDVDVYQDGILVESYDEYEDIIEDTYVEQGALTWSIIFTVGLVLTAVYASSYVAVHNNQSYVSARQFYKTVTKAAEAVKKEAKNWYYPAWVDTKKHNTYILPQKISTTTAAKRVRANIDVYAFKSQMAKNVITAAGYYPYSSKGATGELHTTNCSGKYVFHHWHKGIKKSSGKIVRASKTAHVLYGAPYYVNK